MTDVYLRNVNPIGAVDLPLLGRQDGTGQHAGTEGVGALEHGEVFACDAKLAGRAPSGTLGAKDYDPGEGLLAQVGNYELADEPTKPEVTHHKPRRGRNA